MRMLIVGVLVLAASIYKYGPVIAEDYSNYKSENECIAHFIAAGVERSKIHRAQGECYVR